MNDFNPLQNTRTSSNRKTEDIECLRCGTCCIRHQAITSPEEAKRIAAYLSLTIQEWEKAYSEPRWHSHKNYLIRHINDACIFLKYDNDMSYCDIQPVKPSCCTDWIPNLYKKECREGLRKHSGMTITAK